MKGKNKIVTIDKGHDQPVYTEGRKVPPTVKALRLIRDIKIDSGRQFARLMWPDSPYWSASYNGGHGAARGKGMWLTGGSFLGKLVKRGLITGYNGRVYRLTQAGFTLLEEYEKLDTL